MHCLHHTIRRHTTTLRKTASYYLVHLLVAAAVAYAVTGDWLVAFTLSLIEPTVQAVAYFFHDRAWSRVAVRPGRTLLKTCSYYALHLTVAAGVAFCVTGDWMQAVTLSLLEPTVQMLFFFLHEKLWDRRAQHAQAVLQAAPAQGSTL